MKRMALLGALITVLTLNFLDAPIARAQSQSNGSLTGVVTDSNDKPMVGFAVKLYMLEARQADGPGNRRRNSVEQPAPTELAEKLVSTVTTDAQGKFSFSNVKPGGYMLKGGAKTVGFLYMEAAVQGGKTTDVGRVKVIKQ